MNQMRAWVMLINGAITGVSTGLLMQLWMQPALLFGVLTFLGEFIQKRRPVIAGTLPAFS